MSNNLIQYAFVAGEISEKLLGRTDFEKYDLGLRQAKNWFVDYRGGLTTRPGMEFCEWLYAPTFNTKCFPFQFSPDTSNTYVVIVSGAGYIRFIQDGGYVLEASKNITGLTSAAAGVFTSTSHGFSNGDLVYLTGVVGPDEINGAVYIVTGATTHTFTLANMFGGAVNTSIFDAYVSGGTASRVYTITHSYANADIPQLQGKQTGDLVRFTHSSYPVRNLERTAHTSWTLANEVFNGAVTFVTGPVATPSSAGAAGAGYVVTYIDREGNESPTSNFFYATNSVDMTTTAGFVTLTWTAISVAVKYRVYRTRFLADDNALTQAMTFGYLGEAHGNSFVDQNIIPDFSLQPPLIRDPFSPGQVDYVVVNTGGSGYGALDTNVTPSGGGGSGFRGEVIVVAGAVTGIRVIDPGQNYTTAPTLTISGSGTLADVTAVLTPLTGTYPKASTLFQQRQIYASSLNQPITIWGSQPGLYSNFDEADVVLDNSAYEFTLDQTNIAPIRHIIAVRGGLLLLSEFGLWLLAGESGKAVTPTNATAEPQTYVGISHVEPITIDTELLYVTAKEATVRLLAYNDFSKIYGGQDMSILSSHLFDQANPIIRWAYAEAPYRQVWSVRQDGTFLTFTIVREQNVFAWTPAATKGLARDVVVVSESGRDSIYMTVTRYVNGTEQRFIERVSEREDANLRNAEDAICMDSALTLGATYPAANLIITSVDATHWRFTASAGVFNSGQVDDIIRANGGKFRITTYTSTTVVEAFELRPMTDFIPETTTPLPVASTNWTLDPLVATISGLHHLEGETVTILGDGNVLTEQEVENGQITLAAGVTRAVVGLGFECVAETLPLVASNAIIEGKRKRIFGMAVKRYQSRGLKTGGTADETFFMAERTNEINGEPTRPQTDTRYELLEGTYDIDSPIFMVQSLPLPASILGFVPQFEAGDDEN